NGLRRAFWRIRRGAQLFDGLGDGRLVEVDDEGAPFLACRRGVFAVELGEIRESIDAVDDSRARPSRQLPQGSITAEHSDADPKPSGDLLVAPCAGHEPFGRITHRDG